MSESKAYQRALTLAEAGDYSGAVVQIHRHLKSHPADGQGWNDAGVILYNQGQYAQAMECLLRAQKIQGPGGQVRSNIEQVRGHRAKIAFFVGGDGDTFLKDIYRFLEQRFEVRMFKGNTVEQVRELMEWSDISWFEWATELAEIGTKFPRMCKNIVRLHRYEAYMEWPQKINWDNVDGLITVGNSCVHEALVSQVPDIGTQTVMVTIPNGVDLERIKFVRRRRGRKIAFIGNMRMVKNPMLLLQCMAKLHRIDPEYKLYWAGKVTDAVVEQYIRHMTGVLGLGDVIQFDRWQPDVQRWLDDKNCIVSTSVIESQGMGILEAMAAGIKPVVHNFPGAEQTFGSKYLFNTPEDFCERILSEEYCSDEYRGFVEERYSLSAQLERVNKLITRFEADLVDSKGPVRSGGIVRNLYSTAGL